MEENMKTTIIGCVYIYMYILGLCRDNVKENGNYYNRIIGYILRLYRDNGKEHGNYFNNRVYIWFVQG